MSPWPLGFDRQGRLYDIMAEDGEISGMVRYDSLLQPRDALRFPRYEQPVVERRTQQGRNVAVSRTVLPFAPAQAWAFDPEGIV
jgi:hypothetical protein